ncbi:MAG: SDR family oxidoreductase [Gammaproteobacteria bacterium]|nr:SDR family oxidoreductase [Gammaproteobacteria bacterium]
MLKDKTALVTGGGAGIGRAIAERYAREGATVIVTDFNDDAGQQTVADITRAGGNASYEHLNVCNSAEHDALIAKIVMQHGRLDVACNNAGISGAMVPLVEMTDAQWLEVINTNLSGVFFGIRAQCRAMSSAGGGAIVNISSILGQVGFPATVAYTAAKHGVVGMTQTAAIEYGAQGVRVNAVGPTFIKTSWINNIPPDLQSDLLARHPLARFGEAEEVAALALWLSSDEASYITGAYYPVDGGYLAA